MKQVLIRVPLACLVNKYKVLCDLVFNISLPLKIWKIKFFGCTFLWNVLRTFIVISTRNILQDEKSCWLLKLYLLIMAFFSVLHQAWIQFFYTATWFWTLCYALDVRRVLKSQSECIICYHIIAWLSPAILTSVGLLILYIPHAK